MAINHQKKSLMLAAGQVAAAVHQQLAKLVAPGLPVSQLEATARQLISQAQMTPAFLGYKGYPAATCISINSVIVHGIPTNQVLAAGDLVSIDLGVNNQGWLVDVCRTHPVGRVKPELQRLIDTTQAALDQAIAKVKPGLPVGELGATIQAVVESNGFAVVPELTGHGIGRRLQEPPSIHNYGQPSAGAKLSAGQTIAIEPIVVTEPVEVTVLADNWSIEATDRTVISAHIEDTVMVTDTGVLILTRPVKP